MKVIHTETRQSFAHFLTSWVLPRFSSPAAATNHSATHSTCAIVGGVLTIAGLVDSAIFQSRKRLAGASSAEGFGGRDGKMVSGERARLIAIHGPGLMLDLFDRPCESHRCKGKFSCNADQCIPCWMSDHTFPLVFVVGSFSHPTTAGMAIYIADKAGPILSLISLSGPALKWSQNTQC